MKRFHILFSCLLSTAVFLAPQTIVAKDVVDKPKIHKIGKTPLDYQSAPIKVGIVLLHGKVSGPEAWIVPMVKTLRKKNYWVVTPLMPWAKSRNYNASLKSVMTEIEVIVKKLRAGGATKIFVGGHSKGATVAIAYAARHHDVDGIIVVSPGHIPESPTLQEKIGLSPSKAFRLIKSGKGDKRTSFADLNMGETGKISTSAKIYLSYYDVAGPMNVKENMSTLGAKTAIFWSIAKTEISYLAFEARSRNYIEAAPSNALHTFYETSGGHLAAPSVAKDRVANWIEKVSKH